MRPASAYTRLIALCLLAIVALSGCEALVRLDPTRPANHVTSKDSLSTSMQSAYQAVPIPESWFADIEPLRVDATTKEPGYYALHLESYCLKAGTHSPTDGGGFRLAPLEGPLAPQVRSILQNAQHNPDIPRETIQRVLWAIVLGMSYHDLNDEQREAASRLMPQDQLDRWAATSEIPADAAADLLPGEVRGNLEYAKRVRALVTDPNAPYDEVERQVVTPWPVDVDPDNQEIPKGTWCMTPSGDFWRSFANNYSNLRAELYVPPEITIERDDLDRITRLEFHDGSQLVIETTYREQPAVVVSPEGDRYPIWRFASVTWTAPAPAGAGEEDGDEDDENFEGVREPDHGDSDGDGDGMWSVTVENEGWIFQRGVLESDGIGARPDDRFDDGWDPLRDPNPFAPIPTRGADTPRPTQDDEPTLEELMERGDKWKERYDKANEAYGRAKWAYDSAQRWRTRPGKQDIDRLTDMDHYRDGLDAATGGSPADRAQWLGEHTQRVQRGWLAAIFALRGGRDEDPYDQTGDLSVPGNNGQRLGTSGRSLDW